MPRMHSFIKSRISLCLLGLLGFSQVAHTAGIPNTSTPPYEYIVVGSGAGGGTVAARLALNGKTVLLIDAGEDEGNKLNTSVPVFHAYSTEDTDLAWNFYVNHYQDEQQAVKDDKMVWQTPTGGLYVGLTPPPGSTRKGILYPRSGTLGGCTMHNAQVAVYPVEDDWTNIVNITGDQSWNANHMRTLFERIEKNQYTILPAAGHGYSGYLRTSEAPVIFGIEDAKILGFSFAAANAISGGSLLPTLGNEGRILVGDMNAPGSTRDHTEGVWQIPLTVKHDDTDGTTGKRSSARDFIKQVYWAKNADGSKKYPLDIMMNTLVTRVVFDQSSDQPVATGVEVIQGKSLYRADPRSSTSSTNPAPSIISASKEVIISGGAFNTPQILKLSGIGPREELTSFDIPVLVDLPGVGTNLQDHFEIGVTHQANSDFSLVSDCTYGIGNDPCLEKWQNGDKLGVYGNSNGFPYGVIKKSSVAGADPVYGSDPDLFLFGGIANFKGYYPGFSNDVYRRDKWSWIVLKAHTGNRRGTVTLVSNDPRDTPNITFNFFSDVDNNNAGTRDLQAMSEGVTLGRKITNNVKVPLTSTKFTETDPGTQYADGSPELLQYIKNEAWSHHASCTAPIGADDDPMSVLDSKFRVRGVQGLRVVDASAFPRIPGYFIAIPTFMLGEKAADSILTGV